MSSTMLSFDHRIMKVTISSLDKGHDSSIDELYESHIFVGLNKHNSHYQTRAPISIDSAEEQAKVSLMQQLIRIISHITAT